MPSMKKYIQYNGDIYDIYLDYMSPQDIHVYSIDESFLDVTDYLKMYKKTPRQFAKLLINEIAERTHIPATVGMGSNLYLAKVALDITAKKKAERMLKKGFYNIIGSDLHHEDAIEYITKCKLSKQHIELLKQLLQNNI